MNFETILQSAKDKMSEVTPNDVLKVLGLQLLRNTSIVSRLPYFALFGGGIALGAGAALLFAPKAGSETREAIGSWLKGAFETAKDGATKMLSKGKEVAADAIEDASEVVEDSVTGAKKKAHKATKSVAREVDA